MFPKQSDITHVMVAVGTIEVYNDHTMVSMHLVEKHSSHDVPEQLRRQLRCPQIGSLHMRAGIS